MAAPHISGLAALVLAHHPEFQGIYRTRGPDRVERLFQLIRMSARRVSLADPGRVGPGLPDAVVAVGLQQPAMAAQVAHASPVAPYLGQGAGEPALASLLGGLLPIQQQYGLGGVPFGLGMPVYPHSLWQHSLKSKKPLKAAFCFNWRPQGDSNPCTHRERVMS